MSVGKGSGLGGFFAARTLKICKPQEILGELPNFLAAGD